MKIKPMEFLNKDEETSSSRTSLGTNDVSNDQCHPRSPHSVTSQLPGNSTGGTERPIFTRGEDRDEGNDDEFTIDHNNTLFWSSLRYTRAILALLSAFLLDLTSANNKSIVSKIVRICLTAFVYATIHTSATGLLLWAIAYLMDHGWYILAASCSVVLLLLCGILLAFFEWMWHWRGRAFSYLCGDRDNINGGYNRLRAINILDDDDMEDDLTLRGWVKQISRALVSCLIWSLYCFLNVKIDFWITDQYIEARPSYFAIELRLVNCFEAAPILFGAALLFYFAYPSLYLWNFCREGLSSSAATIGIADTIAAPSASENPNNNRYSITVNEDNQLTMGAGMLNLII